MRTHTSAGAAPVVVPTHPCEEETSQLGRSSRERTGRDAPSDSTRTESSRGGTRRCRAASGWQSAASSTGSAREGGACATTQTTRPPTHLGEVTLGFGASRLKVEALELLCRELHRDLPPQRSAAVRVEQAEVLRLEVVLRRRRADLLEAGWRVGLSRHGVGVEGRVEERRGRRRGASAREGESRCRRQRGGTRARASRLEEREAKAS